LPGVGVDVSPKVSPEWINRNLAVDQFSSNGTNPLTSCLSPGVHFIKEFDSRRLPFFERGTLIYRMSPVQGVK
jgi:hypothetical protein